MYYIYKTDELDIKTKSGVISSILEFFTIVIKAQPSFVNKFFQDTVIVDDYNMRMYSEYIHEDGGGVGATNTNDNDENIEKGMVEDKPMNCNKNDDSKINMDVEAIYENKDDERRDKADCTGNGNRENG